MRQRTTSNTLELVLQLSHFRVRTRRVKYSTDIFTLFLSTPGISRWLQLASMVPIPPKRDTTSIISSHLRKAMNLCDEQCLKWSCSLDFWCPLFSRRSAGHNLHRTHMVHSTTLSWLQNGHLNTVSRLLFFFSTIFFVLFFRRPISQRRAFLRLKSGVRGQFARIVFPGLRRPVSFVATSKHDCASNSRLQLK